MLGWRSLHRLDGKARAVQKVVPSHDHRRPSSASSPVQVTTVSSTDTTERGGRRSSVGLGLGAARPSRRFLGRQNKGAAATRRADCAGTFVRACDEAEAT